MTFTYTGNPRTNTTDEVRFLLNDVTSATAQFTDEEIAYLLSRHTEPVLCAAIGAEAMAAKYALEVNVSNYGNISEDASDRFKHWTQLASALRDQVEYENNAAGTDSNLSSITAGGTRYSQNETYASNPDLIPHDFKVGANDYAVGIENSWTEVKKNG